MSLGVIGSFISEYDAANFESALAGFFVLVRICPQISDADGIGLCVIGAYGGNGTL
jgi:hypothetical protein